VSSESVADETIRKRNADLVKLDTPDPPVKRRKISEIDARPIGLSRRFRKIATEDFWTDSQVKHVQDQFADRYVPDENAKKTTPVGQKIRKQNWIQNSVVSFYIDLIEKKHNNVPVVAFALYHRAAEMEKSAAEEKQRQIKEDKPIGLYRRIRKLLAGNDKFWEKEDIKKALKRTTKKIAKETGKEIGSAALKTKVVKSMMESMKEDFAVPEPFAKLYKKADKMEKAATKREDDRFQSEKCVGHEKRMLIESDTQFWNNKEVFEGLKKLQNEQGYWSDELKEKYIANWMSKLENKEDGIPTAVSRLFSRAKKYEARLKKRDEIKVQKKFNLSSVSRKVLKIMLEEIVEDEFWERPLVKRIMEALQTDAKLEFPRQALLNTLYTSSKNGDTKSNVNVPDDFLELYARAREKYDQIKEASRVKKERDIKRKAFQSKVMQKVGLCPPLSAMEHLPRYAHLCV